MKLLKDNELDVNNHLLSPSGNPLHKIVNEVFAQSNFGQQILYENSIFILFAYSWQLKYLRIVQV